MQRHRPTDRFPWGAHGRVRLLAPIVLAALVAGCATENPASGNADAPEVASATISTLQRAMEEGRTTSAELVELHLARIAAYDREGPALNAIIRLNPRAREQAEALDDERAAGRVRGPLHGIPVVMKDNYDVEWMPTTGSSLALAGLRPPDNAFQVQRLIEAGAVILGKTNLHELAAGITTISSLGGQTRNPYDPARNPGGSSGGTGAAVAADFGVVGWGTDTCGSIRIPAAVHNLFGLRPTKGLSSIDGILPLAHSQDTGGPLARTATDLAIALDATVGFDPADPATAILEGRPLPNFVEALDVRALNGSRVGVLTDWVGGGGSAGSVERVVRGALAEMETLGAEAVDLTIPGLDSLLANTGLIDFEFRFDLEDYLATVPDAPVGSLGEILDAGLHHEALDRNFRRRNARATRESPELTETLARREALRAAIVDFMDRHDLDALAYPTMRQETARIGAPPSGSTCFLSAHTGLPALAMPAGFTESRLPVGLELLGRALDDARLVAMAFAFESAFPTAEPPLRTPPLVNGRAPEPTKIVVAPIARSSPDAATGPEGNATETNDSPLDQGARPWIEADLAIDLPTATLSYQIAVRELPPDDIYGAVLRRPGIAGGDAGASGRESTRESESGEGNDAAGAVVVQRLAGPGNLQMQGATTLSPRLLHELMRGRLELLVHTRAGTVRRRLNPE